MDLAILISIFLSKGSYQGYEIPLFMVMGVVGKFVSTCSVLQVMRVLGGRETWV